MVSLALVSTVIIAVFAAIPTGLAKPARVRRSGSNCPARCKGKWTYSGRVMGTDPWGSVMVRTGVSTDASGTVHTKTCTVTPRCVHTANSQLTEFSLWI